MSAIETFEVCGYTIRPAGTKNLDHRLAFEWTSKDPWHRGIKPNFWTEQDARVDSWILEDKRGPILFFRLDGYGSNPLRADRVQIFIQFPPQKAANGTHRRDRLERIGRAMMIVFPWIERTLATNDVEEVFFDSQSEMLIRFCVTKLGFQRSGARLSKTLYKVAR